MKSHYLRLLIVFLLLLTASLACSTISGSTPESGGSTAASASPTSGQSAITLPTKALVSTPATQPGPCSNPFLPLVEGNRWTYIKKTDEASQNIGMEVIKVEDSQAALTILNMSTNLRSKTTVQCEQGAILGFPVSDIGMIALKGGGDLIFDYQSGVFLPSLRTFESTNWDTTWETRFSASGTFSFEDPDTHEMYSGTLEKSPVLMEWRTVGAGEKAFEAIKVTAGEFPKALKTRVKATLDLKVTIDSEGEKMTLPAKLLLNIDVWFAENVGFLKDTIDTADIILAGDPYPLEWESSLELKDYDLIE